MTTATLISTNDFCTWHQVEYTFITSLREAGLVEITIVDKTEYIPETQLQKLEKMIRMHHDLDINIAGIEAITHLLDRLESIQEDMRTLKNKLRLYEGD
ncbi:chaperone modulator CbpM [Mucilaginibacter sp. McL0603]|uniref:chaperone modulator CbpM n=1 Tax=Mucilaginibacter sp. McL0603 TaxID=3415670 RepID=UPI003CF65FDB